MAVYTRIEQAELEEFLSHYSVGELVAFEGINAGIENTNYFVTCQSGEFVLTVFETISAQELPYFLELMAFLAEHEFPSAHPLADDNGHYMHHLKNKPAALVHKLAGKHIQHPNLAQCREVGRALGHMHAVGLQFSPQRTNVRGVDWWQTASNTVLEKLPIEQQQQLQAELEFQQQHHQQYQDMPRGVIHADLFRDNALFKGDQLTGIIDFYYACSDMLLYDLAITVNDWCTETDGELDAKQVDALIASYHTERPIGTLEAGNWSAVLRAAALRFWLSRALDWHFPRDGELTHSHDPQVFRRILTSRTHTKNSLTSILEPVDKSVD